MVKYINMMPHEVKQIREIFSQYKVEPREIKGYKLKYVGCREYLMKYVKGKGYISIHRLVKTDKEYRIQGVLREMNLLGFRKQVGKGGLRITVNDEIFPYDRTQNKPLGTCKQCGKTNVHISRNKLCIVCGVRNAVNQVIQAQKNNKGGDNE